MSTAFLDAEVLEELQLAGPTGSERREHVRFAVSLDALVCWIDERGDSYQAPALVTDVSGRGFGVEAAVQLPAGRQVLVKALDTSIPCIVRHVRQGERKVHMGLEIRNEGGRAEDSLLRLSTSLSGARSARRSMRPDGDYAAKPPSAEEGAHSERRLYDRRSTELNVLIYWLDPSGTLRNRPGVVRDTCPQGLGIAFERELPPGEPVSIETSQGSLQCVVRGANGCDEGWFLNVEALWASDSRDHRRQLANLAAVLAEQRLRGKTTS